MCRTTLLTSQLEVQYMYFESKIADMQGSFERKVQSLEKDRDAAVEANASLSQELKRAEKNARASLQTAELNLLNRKVAQQQAAAELLASTGRLVPAAFSD